jgi:hypothetical protein
MMMMRSLRCCRTVFLIITLTLRAHFNATDITNPRHLPSERFCLSSSLIDLHTDGYHFYPLDLFYNSTALGFTTFARDTFTIFNCTSQRDQPYSKHICSSIFNPCPVFHQNILDAIERSDRWMKQQPYLYRFWQTMLDSTEVVRLIVLGGSGALGADSQGCYCRAQADARCHYNSRPNPSRQGAQVP